MTGGSAAPVGHPGRGHVALAAIEGIGDGARRRPAGFGVSLVAAAALLAVVANATGLSVHLAQGEKEEEGNYNRICEVKRKTVEK